MNGAWIFALLLLCLGMAHAAGPRYVTGQPYFYAQAGLAIGWKQPLLLYSTDPGDLSANVNHAAADALVAAAAGVWNVPVASITLGQGPALAEHVSGQNVYFGANGLQLPADVMSTNAAAIPLAIVYDTDGSVTDTLLGAGASNPSGCRQNAVTESVDSFDPAGYIAHAIIVINGRCTGPAAAAQQQLRYQLMRVFGRVLGLAWSQTNDNVFTGVPAPTPVQAQNWPIMHPIDIVCGPYTYQCLPNPFTLRIDDIAGLVAVYPINGNNGVPAGKQLSYATSQGLNGYVLFPTGEGMAGVNVLVRRMAASTTIPDAFYAASGVTGTYAVRGRSSPFVAQDTSALGSQGDTDPNQQGRFLVPWWPMLNVGWDDRLITTEPVNPLYTGEYNLGPYPAGNVQPSGSVVTQTSFIVGAGVDYLLLPVSDAAVSCGTGADGTPSAPMEAASTGWWTGLICAFGHVSYVSASVRPGRTFTLEVTALDAAGLATGDKLMPVLGLYGPYDYPGYSLPSLGATVTAFNGQTTGTTTLQASSGTATGIRFGIADQRGDGRPDFNYQARLFYADDLAPANVAASGGSVIITGLGFRNGNAVTVNGVAATVVSWSANAITLTVPTAAAAGATPGRAVDVTVTDRGTGATSTLTAALTYGSNAQPTSMRLITAPGGTLLVGDAAALPFSVQLVAVDGATPVAGVAVTFSATAGAASFGACAGISTCTVKTDASGMATTSVTPGAPGNISVRAAAGTLSQTASFTAIAQASAMLVVSTPESTLRVGVASSNAFAVQDVGPDGKTPLPYRAITFSATAGSAIFDACHASPCTVVSDWTGTARVAVIAQSVGAVTVQARDGDLLQTVTVDALTSVDILNVLTAPPAQVSFGYNSRFAVMLLHADGVTPDYNEPITFTAPPGIHFDECATRTCTLSTDGGGKAYVDVDLDAPIAGTYTLQAAFGSIVQTVSFTVILQSPHLKILSMPADNSPTGVQAAQPFTVQLVQEDDVTPAPTGGHSIVLGGSFNAVAMSACQYSACEITMDGNSTVSTFVTPQQPGPIALSAAYAPLVVSDSFTAVGTTRTMRIANQPGAGGAPIGAESDVAVQVIEPDGVTPMPYDLVTFSVVSGPFTLFGGAATSHYGTGSDGGAYAAGIATGNGPVVMLASDGVVSRLISFQAGAPPRVMKLLSAPASPSTTGQAAAAPFAVQVFAPDGVTPAAGEPVTFTLTGGTASFGGCASATCVVKTDANGKASVLVSPLVAGVVGLLAADGAVTQAASFTAVAPPDVLRVVSAPAAGSYVGMPAASAFAVQVLFADGVTAAAGHSVRFSVSAGSATLAACAGAPTCVLTSDSSGMVSTAVTPDSAGPVTLQAVDGTTVATATFNAVPRPDLMLLVSAPSGNVGTGYPSGTPFTVQLLQGDGVTPEAGKTIVFSAGAGSVRFAACAASTCSVTTGADGSASTAITPLAAGPVTLLATEAALVQSASFNAVALADVLRLTGAPAGGGYAGVQAAGAFAVQVLLADGVTPGAGKSVTLSVTAGSATFAACPGSAPCVLQADSSGMLSTLVTPLTTGTITLQAADGSATVATSFTTIARPDTLKLVTAPVGTLPTGVLAAPAFSVQLLAGDGSADAGKAVLFTATGAQFTGCNSQPCTVITGNDGIASLQLTPAIAGTISLTATYGTLSQTVTFVAYTRPDTLHLISAPTSVSATGSPATQPFAVQVFAGDGTPAAGRSVTLSVAAGAATFAACAGAPACTLPADASGIISTAVTATGAGTITLVATDAQASVSATFTAASRPDILKLIAAPTGTNYAGVPTAASFTVQLLAADGVTPRAGVAVVFSASNATFTACPATPCTLVTDATGTALSDVTPLTPGPVILLATSGALTVSASFTAGANQYLLTPASATFYIAQGVAADVTLSANATQNGHPATTQLLWTGSPGLQPGASSTVTDGNGQSSQSALAGPLAPGAQAQATACLQSTVCTTFTAIGVSSTQFQPTITVGASQSGTTLTPVTATITDYAGHPIVGAPVSVYQTVTAYPGPCPAQGRCPAAPVLVALVTVANSDADGHVTFLPLTVDGLPTETEIALASGTNGFTTTTLLRQP